MYIDYLHLRHFRNYKEETFKFDKEINILFGKNGQGKTNLLESIYFMSTTKSHRGVDDIDMIYLNEDFANIDCHIHKKDEESVFNAVIHKKGKSLCIRNLPIKKISEYVGKINAVLFSPADMTLFDTSPKERRKLIDMEFGKMSVMYINQLNNYNKLLKERNSFLKQGIDDQILLDTITEQMINPQIQIIKKRKLLINQLNAKISDLYQQLSESNQTVHINYLSMVEFDADDDVVAARIKEKYDSSKERDIILKQTNVGIHREDIEFFLDKKVVVSYASQGQKRMIVIALKLALVHIINEYIGENPILLLDDVLSELDVYRRNKLIEIIPKNIQTIITSTDEEDIMPELLAKAKVFLIEKGSVING